MQPSCHIKSEGSLSFQWTSIELSLSFFETYPLRSNMHYPSPMTSQMQSSQCLHPMILDKTNKKKLWCPCTDVNKRWFTLNWSWCNIRYFNSYQLSKLYDLVSIYFDIHSWNLSIVSLREARIGGQQWSGRFLGDPSVCKSNRLHVDNLQFSFIKLGYIP